MFRHIFKGIEEKPQGADLTREPLDRNKEVAGGVLDEPVGQGLINNNFSQESREIVTSGREFIKELSGVEGEDEARLVLKRFADQNSHFPNSDVAPLDVLRQWDYFFSQVHSEIRNNPSTEIPKDFPAGTEELKYVEDTMKEMAEEIRHQKKGNTMYS